jgi:branched-chain amino acid transport system substrate-binding protein
MPLFAAKTPSNPEAVESDEVLFVSTLGTATNSAVQKYLNARRCRSCSSRAGQRSGTTREIFHGRWDLPRATRTKAVPAKFLLKEKPGAKIAILFPERFGKDYLKGMKEGLGDKAGSMIVAEEAFNV